MAYHSDVLVVVRESLNKKIEELIAKSEQESWIKNPDKVLVKNGTTLRFYKRIRYNHTGDAEVKLEHILLNDAEDIDDYHFVRTGDSGDDIEVYGENNDFLSDVEVIITFEE
ncbi:hypothetical protein ACLIA0_15035 [Bacillaceae bacterium W0354]